MEHETRAQDAWDKVHVRAYTSLGGIDRLLGLRLWIVHLLLAAPPGANTHHDMANKQQADRPEYVPTGISEELHLAMLGDKSHPGTDLDGAVAGRL